MLALFAEAVCVCVMPGLFAEAICVRALSYLLFHTPQVH
jgi:hypothetical protein